MWGNVFCYCLRKIGMCRLFRNRKSGATPSEMKEILPVTVLFFAPHPSGRTRLFVIFRWARPRHRYKGRGAGPTIFDRMRRRLYESLYFAIVVIRQNWFFTSSQFISLVGCSSAFHSSFYRNPFYLDQEHPAKKEREERKKSANPTFFLKIARS